MENTTLPALLYAGQASLYFPSIQVSEPKFAAPERSTMANFFKILAIYSLYLWGGAAAWCAEANVACAIRWDAWYSNGENDPAHYTALTLRPERWHSRVPLHGTFDADGNITWRPTAATFAAEIEAAASARLCWAYVMYGANNIIDLSDSMMKALTMHRTAANKNAVKYAMITTSRVLGRTAVYEEAVRAHLELFQDSNYQFIEIRGDHRPLLFLLYDDSDLKIYFGGSIPNLKAVIDALRAGSQKNGSGNPYIVVLETSAQKAENIRNGIGADAISSYVEGHRNGHPQTWAQFEPTIEADWNQYADRSRGDSVPTLRSGADIRARCQIPPPFDHRFSINNSCKDYTDNPTVLELEAEFTNAQKWITSRKDKDPGMAMLIYAWSECDESGNCLIAYLR